jgi:hypothetical protein
MLPAHTTSTVPAATATPNTALAGVVALNENAKALRRYAFEVSLSAFGAIVRSCRAGDDLRGFNQVAMQMRRWSRELELAVQEVNGLASQRVRLVSDIAKKTRLSGLVQKAGAQCAAAQGILAACVAREQAAIARHRDELKHLAERLTETIDGIAQLGMMASVLSRAALIEAASGQDKERSELSIASREFSVYAERVNESVDAVRAVQGGAGA